MRIGFFKAPENPKGKILILANEIYPEICVGGLGQFVAGVAKGLVENRWQVVVLTPEKSCRVYLPPYIKKHRVKSQQLALESLVWAQKNRWWPDWVWVQDWEGIHQMKLWQEKAKLMWTIHNPVRLNSAHGYGYGYGGGYFEKEGEYEPIDWGDDFFDFHGLLRLGFKRADVITTVSKTYARGLSRSIFNGQKIWGVGNGIDKKSWDPARDIELGWKLKDNWQEFKIVNKKIVQAIFSLPQKQLPLFAFISRLAPQKGIDLMIKTLPEFLGKNDVQLVVVGQGLKKYHRFFEVLKNQFPLKVGLKLKADFRLPRQVFAGADFFVLPSVSEPFGIVVAEARGYGAVPLVRAVDGLVDQVKDGANGLSFDRNRPDDLSQKLQQALKLWQTNHWWQMSLKGRQLPMSWQEVAKEYQWLLLSKIF